MKKLLLLLSLLLATNASAHTNTKSICAIGAEPCSALNEGEHIHIFN